jgi:hypothetical protein
LWDRQTLTHATKKRLDALITERLREETESHLEQIGRLFKFGNVYIRHVPVLEKRLTLTRGMPPEIVTVGPKKASVAELVLSPAKTRWTMLVGMFGTGKSTAALHAALESKGMVIFGRCSEMAFDKGPAGTNLLLQRTARSLRLFDDFEDEDRATLERLSGPVLREALARPDSGIILVLDGLDENRAFSTLGGMTALANGLADLRCPILLTTRLEHFDATFGNFDALIDHIGSKRRVRIARIFELESWRDSEVINFLLEAARQETSNRRSGIVALAAALEAGHEVPWPRELLRHPLFLQMIAELAAAGQTGTTGRAETIEEYVCSCIAITSMNCLKHSIQVLLLRKRAKSSEPAHPI